MAASLPAQLSVNPSGTYHLIIPSWPVDGLVREAAAHHKRAKSSAGEGGWIPISKSKEKEETGAWRCAQGVSPSPVCASFQQTVPHLTNLHATLLTCCGPCESLGQDAATAPEWPCSSGATGLLTERCQLRRCSAGPCKLRGVFTGAWDVNTHPASPSSTRFRCQAPASEGVMEEEPPRPNRRDGHVFQTKKHVQLCFHQLLMLLLQHLHSHTEATPLMPVKVYRHPQPQKRPHSRLSSQASMSPSSTVSSDASPCGKPTQTKYCVMFTAAQRFMLAWNATARSSSRPPISRAECVHQQITCRKLFTTLPAAVASSKTLQLSPKS